MLLYQQNLQLTRDKKIRQVEVISFKWLHLPIFAIYYMFDREDTFIFINIEVPISITVKRKVKMTYMYFKDECG